MPDHFPDYPMDGLPTDLFAGGAGGIIPAESEFPLIIDFGNTLDDGKKARMIEHNNISNAELRLAPAKAHHIIIMIEVGGHTLSSHPVDAKRHVVCALP